MKKNLIALAVLAAAGAASAQSSVTLYGIADAYVGSLKDTINLNAPVSPSQTVVNTGGLSSSRWGMKGTEDLGNGLKANFQLEGQFSTDSGAQSGDLFGRKSTVGLSGNFGSVDVGRNYTALQSLRAATNNIADTNLSMTGDVWAAGTTYADGKVSKSGDYALRVSNSVRFDSNVYNGFSGSVAYGFGENKATGKDSTDNLSLHVKYANGPLLVGYAHQTEKQATVASSKYNLFGATYNFGVAKLVGAYQTVKRAQSVGNGGEDKEYQVGVEAPFGAFTFYAGYADSKNETTAGASVEERSGYTLAATYALSKRTTAYAGYKSVEVDAVGTGAAQAKGNEISQLAIGVRHAF
jgi:predicted porin